MNKKIAQEFSTLWTFLGDHHNHIEEAQLIESESRLFSLKKQLSTADVPYIMHHIDSHRAIQTAMLDFLR